MSRIFRSIAVSLILLINRLFPLAPNLRELENAKQAVDNYQEWERRELERLIPEFGEHWTLQQCTVLDIGCGLGGKTLFYAKQGARRVVGIDLRPFSIEEANKLASEEAIHNVSFNLGDAARMPFATESFDIIVSVNVFEHIDDLFNTLLECKRVLKHQGKILLHFPPFYSPWGAHLEGWINFPWPHVFFDDETLLDAAACIEAYRHNNQQYISTANVNWSQFRRLPELNRVTAEQFLHLLQATGLKPIKAEFLPFGRHYFSKKGSVGQMVATGLWRLAQLPVAREIVTTKMVFILQKAENPCS